jgi:PPOX class probable F420-dependent enzyme
VDEAEARRRFSEARVARFATADEHGRPHVVPIVFAVEGDEIHSIVDAKPKRSPRLKRLANLSTNPRASVLVDHYDEDWEQLWWIRADATARVVEHGPERDRAVELLRVKYPQYETWAEPVGAAVILQVDRWRWWSPAGD